jgi:peptidyl-prolyl cis-trans isomerase B (cyclophilin B)
MATFARREPGPGDQRLELRFSRKEFKTTIQQIFTIKMKVQLTTSMGVITLSLNQEKAPLTVENFIKYVNAGYYNGTIFHRVINDFMVQGGGMDAAMNSKPSGAPIKNEANNGLANTKYSIAMARTNDPHSATGQFFINVKDNAFLNHSGENMHGWGYCVFGEVIEGQEVVDAMKVVPTGRFGGHDDVPKEAIVIESAVVLED